MGNSGSHHCVTKIHAGQSFQDGVNYNEHYSFIDGEGLIKEALAELQKSAMRIIPAGKMKDVVFCSIHCWGRIVVTWRYGDDWWVNDKCLNHESWDRQVYEA